MIINNTKWVDIPFFLTKNEYTNDINLIKDSNAIRSSIKNIIATKSKTKLTFLKKICKGVFLGIGVSGD